MRERAVTETIRHHLHQRMHRRAGDIVPGPTDDSPATMDEDHDHSCAPEKTSEEPNSGFEESQLSENPDKDFYHYKPPNNWDQNLNSLDIQPGPERVAGGMSLRHSADLIPSQADKQHESYQQSHQDSHRQHHHNNRSLSDHDTMTYNTRPSDLRVQTALSRGRKPNHGEVSGRRPPSRSPSPSNLPRKYSMLRDRGYNNSPMRSSDPNASLNMTVDSLNYESHDKDKANYKWVQQMKNEENRRVSELQSVQFATPGKGTVYDDHVSVHSTPPNGATHTYSDTNGTSGGGKTARQIQNLREMKLVQGATNALRWLSSLNIPHCEIPIMSPLDGIQPDGSFRLAPFTNGVLFCKLIESLARLKQPIAGFCEKPHSRAQCVQNVRRFLDTLTKINKVDFPIHIKSYEEDILLGKGEVIVDLLLKMKESYKFFKTSPSTRHPRHSL